CVGQRVFSRLADFAGVCVSPVTLLVYSHRRRQSMERMTSPSTKFVLSRDCNRGSGAHMTASDKPNSPPERNRARRHKVARRLYEETPAEAVIGPANECPVSEICP